MKKTMLYILCLGSILGPTHRASSAQEQQDSFYQINSARWIAAMVRRPVMLQFLTSAISGRPFREVRNLTIEQQQALYNDSIAGLPPELSEKVSSLTKKLGSGTVDNEEITLDDLIKKIQEHKKRIAEDLP